MFRRKLMALFRRARFDKELEEEMQLHRELRARQIASSTGSSAQEARQSAGRAFGNATRQGELSRDAWRWRRLEEFAQDLRYAARLLRRSPLFALTAIVTLALAIGANTAIFSVLDGVLLRPLPYHDPARLVVVWDKPQREDAAPIFASYHDFEQYRQYAKSFASVAAATWATESRVWMRHGSAKTIFAVPVSVSFFDTLGVHAMRGRTFKQIDEQSACAVVLSYTFWRDELHGAAAALGSDLVLDDTPCDVVGIMGRGFSFYPRQAKLWMLAGPHFRPDRQKMILGVFARLRPGVTLAQAQTEVSTLHRSLHESDKDEQDVAPAVFDLQQQFTFLAGRTIQQTIWLLGGAVFLLLLIACLNVANLLAARSLARSRELGVRAALGSGKARLVRQLLTESVLLASLSCAGGVALAWAAVRAFTRAQPIELPVGAAVNLDGRVLAFSVLLTAAATLLFGLLPALRSARVDISESLKAAGRGHTRHVSHQRFSRALVTLEVAITALLLLGANLLGGSLLHMENERLGFDPRGLLYTGTAIRGDLYKKVEQKVRLYDRLWHSLREAGLGAPFALADTLPVYAGGGSALEVQGRAPKPSGKFGGSAFGDVGHEHVSPGYFALLRTQLLAGRDFDERDNQASNRVAVVNRALVREYFPDGRALGKQIRIPDDDPGGEWMTVVGVVEDQKHSQLMHEMSWVATPIVYQCILQSAPPSAFVFLRTSDAGVARKAQHSIASIDAKLPVDSIESVGSTMTTALAFPRFRALLVGAFALAALLLAAVGLHGVLAQLVLQRAGEFGIRMALGGTARDITLLVVRQGGIPVLLGLALGLVLSFACGRALGGLLYGLHANNPWAVGMMVALLSIAALIATLLPARRAARADPAVALRSE